VDIAEHRDQVFPQGIASNTHPPSSPVESVHALGNRDARGRGRLETLRSRADQPDRATCQTVPKGARERTSLPRSRMS
jgi:hypothetical protein